jgi:hypothetical protein
MLTQPLILPHYACKIFGHVWQLHYSPLIFRDYLLNIFNNLSLYTVLHYTEGDWRLRKRGMGLWV